MNRKTSLFTGAALFSCLGLFLLGGLLLGQFRQETSFMTGHVVKQREKASLYHFLYKTRVYEGEIEGAVKEGEEVRVYFDPEFPSRNHARVDGGPPPFHRDSGFPIPAVGGVFALAIGIGFLIAMRRG